MLEAFIRWHLALGFVRIYLYFDDPLDAGIACARRLGDATAARRGGSSAVVAVPCDGALRGEWSKLETYSEWGERIDSMVEVRQLLNCEHALRRAHRDADIDWLLHIDSDELFHISDLDAAAHFGRLSAHGCVAFNYVIHEGCPEEADGASVFERVTLFRRHLSELGALRFADEAARGRAAAALDFWRGRHTSQTTYFLGSEQGKSAVRVLPGARPMSVHTFYPPHPPASSRSPPPKCFVGFEGCCDPFGANYEVRRPMGSPCVLHYISCSFDFWHEKYRLLGRFADSKPTRNAEQIGEQIGDCFHTFSRDLVASSDREVARAAYRQHVCLEDADEARRQLEAQVCFRVLDVRRLLREAAGA